jgi:endonuclease/exonuclease/phosphatase family metal-dependent hydrolase
MGSYTDGIIPQEIVFMEYNMDRAGHWQEIVNHIQTNYTTVPSVIFISEIDRGCHNSGELFLIEEMAKQLKMDYVYGPEYLQYRDSSKVCTTGNGILSKFPLESVEYMLFKS